MTRTGTSAARRPAAISATKPPPSPPSAWARISDVLDKTTGFLFIAVLLVVPGLMLILTQQGRDLLQAVADGLDRAEGVHRYRTLGWLLAAALLLGLQAWFWTRAIVERRFGDHVGWKHNPYLVWTPRGLGLLPFVLLAAGFWRIGAGDWRIWALLAVGGGFLAFVVFRRKVEARVRNAADHLQTNRSLGASRALHGALRLGHGAVLYGSLAGCAIGLAVFIVWPVAPAQFLGPAAVALLAIALVIPVMTVLIQAGWQARVATVPALFALAIIFSLWVDNHAVRLSPASAAARPDIPTAFARWRAGLPQDGRTVVPIIFVASQGGASRAGYWTADALALLEEETNGRFSRHVFAISSVSGGSLGAAAFLAAIHDQPSLAARRGLRPLVERFVQQDYLSPALGGMLFPDLFQRFVPFAVLPDRGRALEQGWEAGWAKACPQVRDGCRPGRMGADFLSLWSGTDPGWLPILMVGGATQETGRPLITSNVALGPPPWAGGASGGGFVDADDFHAVAGHDVRLSTAILNGARFPYISPAGTLPDGQHVVDGGYFDAAGVEAVRQLAGRLFDPRRRALADTPAMRLQPIYLLLLNGDPPQKSWAVPLAGAAAKPPATGAPRRNSFAQDFWGPMRGLYHSRGAHGERLMRDLVEAAPGAGDLAPIVIRLQVCHSLAMDWALSPQMTDTLSTDLDGRRRPESVAVDPGVVCDNAAELAKLEKLLADAAPAPAAVTGRPR